MNRSACGSAPFFGLGSMHERGDAWFASADAFDAIRAIPSRATAVRRPAGVAPASDDG